MTKIDEAQRERIRERRRERYHNDPEYRERIKANNRRYLRARREAEPTREEVFDRLFAAYREEWMGDTEGVRA